MRKLFVGFAITIAAFSANAQTQSGLQIGTNLGRLFGKSGSIVENSKIKVGVVFGVVREWHGKGVEAALVVEGEISINARGNYNDFVITWIGDFNQAVHWQDRVRLANRIINDGLEAWFKTI